MHWRLSIFICIHLSCFPLSFHASTLTSYYSDIIFATGANLHNRCTWVQTHTHTQMHIHLHSTSWQNEPRGKKSLLVFLSFPHKQPNLISAIFHTLLIGFWWYFGGEKKSQITAVTPAFSKLYWLAQEVLASGMHQSCGIEGLRSFLQC